MISLEYLTLLEGKRVEMKRIGELVCYETSRGLTYPLAEVEHRKLISRLKGRIGAYFDAEQAYGTFMANDPSEDIYYYSKEEITNPERHFYREHRYLIERYQEAQLVQVPSSAVGRLLKEAEAPAVIELLAGPEYLTRFFQIKFNGDDLGLIALIPIKKDLHYVAFSYCLTPSLESILDYLILTQLPIKNLGKKIPLVDAEVSGIYPYHFGVILDPLINDLVKHFNQDIRLQDILYLSRFNAIDVENKFVLTGGYKYFFPYTKIKTSEEDNFVVLSKFGASYLRYKSQMSDHYRFFEYADFPTFARLLRQVPEFAKENFFDELAKAAAYGGNFVILRSNGKIVGGYALETVCQEVFVSYAFILPEYRLQGFFKQLVENMCHLADQMRKNFHLVAISEVAKKVYLSFGFKPVGHVFSDDIVRK